LKQSLAANYSLVFRWAPCSTSTAAAAKQKEEDEQQQEEDKGGDSSEEDEIFAASLGDGASWAS